MVYDHSYDVHFPNKSRLDSLAFYGNASRGFSGALVFNNNGHLLGTLFGGDLLDDEQEVSFATKSIYITPLINEVIRYLK